MGSALQWTREFLAKGANLLFGTSRRKTSVVVEVEQLEDRVNPVAGLQEQYMLELVNRMRENPAAELSILLNSTDPSVQSALSYFNVNRTTLTQQWAALSPAAPLAWNDNLATAAAGHNQFMINAGQQSHQLPGEPAFGTRFTNAGYTNWTYGAENIFAYADSVFQAHAAFAIDWGSGPGGIQSPAGHRNNIMNSGLREVGISIVNAPAGSALGPLVVTQDFGTRSNQGNPYFLGSIYGDTNRDGYYSYGEGLSGVTVRIVNNTTGAVVTTTTTAAGGYQVQLGAGSYSVTVSGGAFTGSATRTVTIGSANVHSNFVNGTGVVSNTPPTLAAIATQNIQQGGSAAVTLSGADANGDTLTYSARLVNSTPTGTFNVVVSGNRLTVTPPSGFVGVATIEASVSDGRGGTATQSFVLNVAASATNNYAPVLGSLPSVDLFSGQVGRVQLSATDADNNPLTYSAQLVGAFATPPATLSVSGNQLSIATTTTFTGTFDVRVTVSDGTRTDSRTLRVTVTSEASPVERLAGDFNGNGAGDILTLNADGSLWLGQFGAGDTISLTRFGQMPNTSWKMLKAGDVNGDGKTDILGFSNSGIWYVGLSTGTSMNVAAWNGWNNGADWKFVLTGDFNGDGRMDAAGMHKTGGVFLNLSTGTGFQVVNAMGFSDPNSVAALMTGDFNGDRKTDLVGMSTNGAWNVYLWNNAATGSLFTARTGASWNAFSTWRNLLVGDFNGDGKSDVAAQGTNGVWYFGMANGSSSGAIFNTVAGNQWYTPNNYNTVFAADVNGDGRTDIVGVSTNTWYVQRSSGSSFVTSIWGTSPSGGWSKVMAQDNPAARSGNVLQFVWDGSWDYGQSTGSSFAFRRLLRVRDF